MLLEILEPQREDEAVHTKLISIGLSAALIRTLLADTQADGNACTLGGGLDTNAHAQI